MIIEIFVMENWLWRTWMSGYLLPTTWYKFLN